MRIKGSFTPGLSEAPIQVSDILTIGVDMGGPDGDTPILSVGRMDGRVLTCLNIITGKDAEILYKILTDPNGRTRKDTK